MEFVDANVILRYLLEDNEEQFEKATDIIESSVVTLTFEVLTEVVFVLLTVYKIPRETIASMIVKLSEYPTVRTNDHEVLKFAFALFAKTNLDVVDCFLIGYNHV